MMRLTKEQQRAVLRKYQQSADDARSYLAFRRRVSATFGMDGAVVLPWCGMFLAIETDGYTHS